MTDESERPAGRLGAFDLGCVAVGGIVGVGIFFTPAVVARRVDSVGQALSAWLLGGLGVALGALVFAELAVLRPGHGGTYRYIREAFGRLPAFLFGWSNGCLIQAGAAGIIGLVFADNLDVLLYGSAGTSPAHVRIGAAVLAITLFTVLNLFGLDVGKRVQNGLTVGKVAAVLSIVALGVWAHDGGAILPPPAPLDAAQPLSWAGAMMAALLPVLFASGGWQHASFLAGAARNPKRDVPLGITAGVAVVVIIYLAVNVAYLDLLGLDGARASSAIAADAARAGLSPLGHGDLAAQLLAFVVCVSSLGILNTISLAPPYVFLSMARDGVFFAAAGKLSTRNGAPIVGVLIQGFCSITLLLMVSLCFNGDPGDTLGFLLDGVVFVDWAFFFLCGLALLRLRRCTEPGGFRAPGGQLIALGFCAMSLLVAVSSITLSPAASATGLASVLLGAAVYWLLWRKR